MNDERDRYHEFDKRIAVLEERMETQLAKNESAIDRLRADMEKRDKENQRWIIGLVLACTGIIVAAVALL